MSGTARFDELKKKFDENPRRYFAPLANEFRKSGDAEQAVLICEEFLPQQPGHMSGHIVYGQALFDLGRLDDARTVFETALTLDPENLIALRHLGDIARSHGDLGTARQWYQRVLEADPRNEEVQALIASLEADEAATAAPSASALEEPAPVQASFAEPVTTDAFEQSSIVELSPLFEPPAAPPPAVAQASAPPAESLLDLDFVEEHPIGSAAPQFAEGFEAMEFTPPSPAAADAGMAEELVSGEFTAPPSSVAPLEGLEETALGAFESRGEATSPPPLPALEPLPVMEEAPHELAGNARAEASVNFADEPPVDIPPEVIAAEAELIDARESLAAAEPTAPAPAAAAELSLIGETPAPTPPRVTPSQPFVTETMAELYVKQGFREQALDVYKLLLAASPESQRLRDRVAELQQGEVPDDSPNVRAFLARLAARRPGDGSAATVPPAGDDFAALDSFETVPASTSESTVPSVADAAASVPPELAGLPMLDDEPLPLPDSVPSHVPVADARDAGDGSIDALFGQRNVDQADASAASALAQAFGNEQVEPLPITGRPARAAAGELSLDSVFRDGGARPPRSAQSFSFDQFFSESAAAEPAASSGPPPTPSQGSDAQTEPAERSADDIEQFNSWLQGLKQK